MTTKLTVFLETTIFKFAADELLRQIPEKRNVDWGGQTFLIDVHNPVRVFPNEKINNSTLKEEVDLLPKVAELGKKSQIRFATHFETKVEYWGLPKTDCEKRLFYGAPISLVASPIKYGRIFISSWSNPKRDQFEFLCSIKDKRFLELQEYTGAYQGQKKTNMNSLLDAFHIWCAEFNECGYFLTCDFKLIDHLKQQKKFKSYTQLVKPSELLSIVTNPQKKRCIFGALLVKNRPQNASICSNWRDRVFIVKFLLLFKI